MSRGEPGQTHPNPVGGIEYAPGPPVPDDPYNWRMIQFSTLEQMGYPVEVEVIPRTQARETYGEVDPGVEPFVDYQFRTFSQWGRPAVLVPEFAKWVSGWINPDPELVRDPHDQATLAWHPAAVLPYAVDNGYFRTAKSYVDEVIPNPPEMARSDDYRVLFRSCYVSALDRLMERADVAPAFLRPGIGEGEPGRTELAQYRSYVRDSVRPVTPEGLQLFMRDFYVMLGSIAPEFGDFSKH